MSWLNATNFTSLAKNVLREAQKTIDKALDISEQEQQQQKEMLEEQVGKIDTPSDIPQPGKEQKLNPEKIAAQLKASVWGSFSGSFFESPSQDHGEEKTSACNSTISEEPISSQPDNLISEPAANNAVQEWDGNWTNQPLIPLPDTPLSETNEDLVSLSEDTHVLVNSLSLPLQSPNSPDVAVLTPSPSLVELPSSTSSSSIEIIQSPNSTESLASPPQAYQSPTSQDNDNTNWGQENNDESAAESFHSSLSASSSLTVISPDTETVETQEHPSESLRSPPEQNESGLGSIEDTKSVTSQTSNTSSDVKRLLEDAFHDPQPAKNDRETSPSSSDRSIMKMECEFPSGQTSGDEIETTTSSDIEVVSSPNGDRRITVYTASPRDGNHFQGHKREPSNISVGSDESCSPAMDTLLKRLADMSRVLEVRETKLIELSRINATLEEETADRKSRLDGLEKVREAEASAIRRMTEDFAQRFSNIEKKLQQANVEKETLSKQYEQLKNEKTSVEELSEQLANKDKLVEELREEGEKLSKKQLLLSNLIKKMRAKEKETENIMKNQNELIEDLTKDVERLKKSLAAKEELERSQIDAVRQLTYANLQFDKELSIVRTQNKELMCECDILRTAASQAARDLEEAKIFSQAKEAGEVQKALSLELSVRQELQVALEEATHRHLDEQQQLLARMEELNKALATGEVEHGQQVELLRQENVRLMQRLEQAERAVDAQNNDLAAATKPLLRQIESLQASLTSQRANEEKLEQTLTAKLSDTQRRCDRALEKEKQVKDVYVALQSKTGLLEHQIRLLSEEKSRLELDLASQSKEVEKKEAALETHCFDLEAEKSNLTSEMGDLKQQIVSLQQELAMERTALDAERQKCLQLQVKSSESKGFIDLEDGVQRLSAEATSIIGRDSETPLQSPTPSLSRLSGTNSLTESFTSNPWATQDDILEGGITTPVARSCTFDMLRGGTSVLENLQAQLKLREGEVSQLQLELLHQERTRESLTQELSKLLSVNETLANQAKELEALKALHADLERKYNALLQMYGEKIEETEELRLDLLDVKEMYKAQIDQLLRT